MHKEDKELLLRDLCARLPYGVKLRYVEDLVVKKESHTITLNNVYLEHIIMGDADIKPYLRPMSSMTKEERMELFEIEHIENPDCLTFDEARCIETNARVDWLDRKMFDHRGLLPKGWAIEMPKEMYKS